MVTAQEAAVVITVLFTTGFAFLAFSFKVLDAAGSALAWLLALVIALTPGLDPFAGLRWLALLGIFVLLGFAITKLFWDVKGKRGVTEGKTGTRGWRNVAANGLVPAILAFLTWPGIDTQLLALGFAVAVATASSDTFASELGVLSTRTYLITSPFKRVPPGTNGGVSLWGQFVALVGSTLPAVAAVYLIGIPWSWAWIPIVAGWMGCQLDSVLGALFEEGRGRVYGFMTKSDVNFLSIAVMSFAALLLVGA